MNFLHIYVGLDIHMIIMVMLLTPGLLRVKLKNTPQFFSQESTFNFMITFLIQKVSFIAMVTE